MAQHLASLLGVVPELLQPPPREADQERYEDSPTHQNQCGQPTVLVEPRELDVERALHGHEEIEIDDRADDREEDLLDEIGRDPAGERRATADTAPHPPHAAR